jgi:hypothetical protein
MKLFDSVPFLEVQVSEKHLSESQNIIAKALKEVTYLT